MNRITHWLKKQKTSILTGLILWLLLVVNIVIIDNASAQTLVTQISSPESSLIEDTGIGINDIPEQSLTTEQPYTLGSPEIDNAFQKLVTKTQFSFERYLQEANNVIGDLSLQLERAATETQPGIRKQIKDDLEDRQDSLENIADSVDDLAEKVKDFNEDLGDSDWSSEVAANPQFQKNSYNFQYSLENVAETIDNLADNVERGKKNTTAAFRTQIEQQIEAVNQALEEATRSFQAINQNPA